MGNLLSDLRYAIRALRKAPAFALAALLVLALGIGANTAISRSQQRFTMLLLAAFAGFAVILVAVGIYSVLAYSARRRMREIGIRMALGAQISDVLRMVIVDGLRPTLLGIAIGMAGALALGRALASLVYGVGTRDLATLASVSVALVAVGVGISLLPAWRAAQVEPVQILHEE